MNNELLLFIHLFLVFGFTIGALRLGKEALVAWIALQSVLANLFVLKQVTLFSFDGVCCDIFMLGVVLGLNLLQEYFGKAYAKRAVLISFLAMAAFAVLAKMHLFYQPSASDWSQSSYEAILSPTPRMLVASLTTFFLVQQFDVRFFSWLRSRCQKMHLSLRTTLSIILSQAIDTVLFTFLGLYGIVDHLFSIIFICFFIKFLIAISAAPVTLLSKKIVALKPEKTP
jgi:queuosine precursor transporter